MSTSYVERLRSNPKALARLTDDEDTTPHYLYRLYAKDGTLLYIGCTGDVQGRIYYHLSMCHIGNGITHALYFGLDHWTEWRYPTKAEARAAERAAIAAEAPLLNKAHNKGRYTTLPSGWGRDDHNGVPASARIFANP